MGKKKEAPVEKKEEAKEAKEEEEDDPLVKQLKEADDKYLEIEREYERELQALHKVYAEKQAPLLEQRRQRLATTAEESANVTGTPALKGFWLQALKNLPALDQQIESWDEPVLEYLSDIKQVDLDPDDEHKGFKLSFMFVENPYMSNTELWKEYHTEESSPYTGEIDVKEIKASEIDWNPGKDVTVEKVKKNIKGGGAKKAKQKAKEKAEPRDSFFRMFFRDMEPDMEVPDDMDLDPAMCEDSDLEEDALMSMLMDRDHDIGHAMKSQLIPFAIRWYTGEAVPEGFKNDDDDEDEEEEEEDDDDDDDDDDDEPLPASKKAQAKKKGGGAEPAPKQEECKQQ